MSDQPKTPPILNQIWTAAQAVSTFVADGFSTVTPEQYSERMAICEACPNRNGSRCRLCGCNLAVKARGRAFQCPDNPPRWLYVPGPERERNTVQTDQSSDAGAAPTIDEAVPPDTTSGTREAFDEPVVPATPDSPAAEGSPPVEAPPAAELPAAAPKATPRVTFHPTIKNPIAMLILYHDGLPQGHPGRIPEFIIAGQRRVLAVMEGNSKALQDPQAAE